MTLPKLALYLGLLIAGGGIGFFLGIQNQAAAAPLTEKTSVHAPDEKSEVKTATETEKPAVETETKTQIAETENAPADENATEEIADTTNPESETVTEKLPTKPAPEVVSQNAGPGELCFTDEGQISTQLTLFAERKEAENLMYDNVDPANMQDCSGIFHRTAAFVGTLCDRYKYPDPAVARDSRSLAKWYHDNNNLTIIDDPVRKRNLIRLGSVMFFGKSGKKYAATADIVTAPRPKGIIQHIGVVTEVTRDAEGNVIGYVMFHGRRPGKRAERSHYHKIKPPRLGFPILGNWSQQWVAVANIMTEDYDNALTAK